MKINITIISLLLCIMAFAQNRKGTFSLQPGSASHRLYVSFKTNEEAHTIPGFAALSEEYSITTKRAVTIPEEKLQELEALAMKNTGSGRSVAKLRNIYELQIAHPSSQNILKLAGELEKLDDVEYCSLVSKQPIPPPYDIAPLTPVFDDEQTYITDFGVNMTYAWDMGLTGQGINLRDVEYGVNLDHEEFNEKSVAHAMEIGPDVPVEFGEHGTAVFGVMYADKGGYGISGMAHGANEMILYPESTVDGYDRVNAVAQSIADSTVGDIIVYEMQTFGPTAQYCPAEYENVIWDLTKAASDAGIIIVAAAGNGNQNLDSLSYLSYMQRGDSGAIIVGAGANDETHERLGFSTFGARVNVQGWGYGVFTSGYGDAAQIGGDFNQRYTNFNGTSSATPIVAGCVAVLQSYYHSLTGQYLSGTEMRQLLMVTGKPQGPLTFGNVGPLPDMEAAIAQIDNMLGTPTVNEIPFTIYPNPVQDRLTITLDYFSGNASAEVYNSIGQLINSTPVSPEAQLDFSNLPKGIYIVKVTNGEKTAAKRIVKK